MEGYGRLVLINHIVRLGHDTYVNIYDNLLALRSAFLRRTKKFYDVLDILIVRKIIRSVDK